MLIQNIMMTRGTVLDLKREGGERKTKETQPQGYLSDKVMVFQGHCFLSPSGIICIALHNNLKGSYVPVQYRDAYTEYFRVVCQSSLLLRLHICY